MCICSVVCACVLKTQEGAPLPLSDTSEAAPFSINAIVKVNTAVRAHVPKIKAGQRCVPQDTACRHSLEFCDI